jgi:hypothetical protein
MVVLVDEDASRCGAAASPATGSTAPPNVSSPMSPFTGFHGSPAASVCEPGSDEARVSIPSGHDLWHFLASGSPSS